jgi:DNA-binding MarR family transcriptional regulator
MHHQKCSVDRRAVRVRLTEKGQGIRSVVEDLFQRHADGIISREVTGDIQLQDINASLRGMERYWTDQIRYIY